MDNKSNSLSASKQFNCSKDKLYHAWTDEEALKQWWKPLGKTLKKVVNDIRQGGEVRYEFENDLTIDGKYEEAAETKLKYSWNWHVPLEPVEDSSFTLTVSFDGDENQSTIEILQEGFKHAESIKPHQQGWDDGLNQLANFLDGNTENSGQNANEESGYREVPDQQKVGGA